MVVYMRTSPGNGTDAVIPVIGALNMAFDVVLSYDINISSLPYCYRAGVDLKFHLHGIKFHVCLK